MHRLLSALSLNKARLTLARGKVIRTVAKRFGLVSFGAVDASSDDHEVIRGLTVSTTHTDKHYAVGTFDGYDVAVVDRYDRSRGTYSSAESHNWAIVQVTLQRALDLPHVFLLPLHRAEHYDQLFTGTRHLSPVHQFSDAEGPVEFVQRYQLYVAPRDAFDAEAFLTTEFYRGVAAHFWPHAIEIKDGKVLVYLTQHRLEETVLESAIQAALWLADWLDIREA